MMISNDNAMGNPSRIMNVSMREMRKQSLA